MLPAFLKNDDCGKLILRLTLGGLMLFHGVSKVMNPGGALAYVSGKLAALGLPSFIAYGVFLGEVVAPLLIIIGLFSRIGGIIIIGNMVFAVVLAHQAQVMMIAKTGGWMLELQAFYLLTALAVCFLGSGKWALKPD